MSCDMKATKEKMQKAVDHLQKEYANIRAGRANPSLLDKIMVDYYGAPTPINQMAAVSVTEARILMIQPWDASTIKLINKAILASDLGITPTDDGKSIRLVFPQPTEERRKEQCKSIKKEGEDTKVTIRNIRRDFLDSMKKMKKEATMTEDELATNEKQLQKLTDQFCAEVEQMVSAKEKEVMSL